jgi:hypothetical protein
VLAGKNATVIVAVRNRAKTAAVKGDKLREFPNAMFVILELDLSSLSSVRQYSHEVINMIALMC